MTEISPTVSTEPTPSAPSATEPSAPLNTEALPSSPEPVDEEFAFLRNDKPVEPVAPAVAAPTVPPSPAEAMAAAGAPQQTPASPPVVPVAAAPAAIVPQAPAPAAIQPQAAPAAAPQTPEQVHAQYQEHRQSRIKELAEKTFVLDDATIEALQTEPATVIPLLMAQATMAAMEATTVAFANMLPGAIMQVTEQQSTFKKNEDDFFGAWPALNKPEFRGQLDQAGQLYRQLNPRATKEDFIRAVGGAVAASLGIAAPAPQAQIAPAAPRQAPHSPISASAPRSMGAPQSSENRFASLIDD